MKAIRGNLVKITITSFENVNQEEIMLILENYYTFLVMEKRTVRKI